MVVTFLFFSWGGGRETGVLAGVFAMASCVMGFLPSSPLLVKRGLLPAHMKNGAIHTIHTRGRQPFCWEVATCY